MHVWNVPKKKVSLFMMKILKVKILPKDAIPNVLQVFYFIIMMIIFVIVSNLVAMNF